MGLAPLFLLIILGNVLRRESDVLHISHVPVINSLVIGITLPALIFLALIKAPPMNRSSLILPLLLIASEAVTLAAALAMGKALNLNKSTVGMICMTGAFGNTAFLGYPISRSLLPNMFPTAVMIDEFGMMLVMYICGAVIMGAFGDPEYSGGSPAQGISKFLRGQIFLAIFAAMLLRNIPWPHWFHSSRVLAANGVFLSSLSYLAQGTTPLILLAVGASLRPRAALATPKAIILPSVLKLVVCPLAMVVFCHFAGMHGDARRIGILQAAMPTGVLASVLCGQGRMEGSAAVGAVCATTALSAISIPAIIYMLH